VRDDAGVYYVCCADGCLEMFYISGIEPRSPRAREQARAAGWWVWRDDDHVGQVYCPAHLDGAPALERAR